MKLYKDKAVFPSGRWLWCGGTPWIKKLANHYGAYNCLSISIDSLLKASVQKTPLLPLPIIDPSSNHQTIKLISFIWFNQLLLIFNLLLTYVILYISVKVFKLLL
jgi:hypothetical protein